MKATNYELKSSYELILPGSDSVHSFMKEQYHFVWEEALGVFFMCS